MVAGGVVVVVGVVVVAVGQWWFVLWGWWAFGFGVGRLALVGRSSEKVVGPKKAKQESKGYKRVALVGQGVCARVWG